MPTLTLSLRSQRGKPVPDRTEWVEVRGRLSGPLHRDSIDYRPSEIVLDVVPDRYTVHVEAPGFVPTKGEIDVGRDAIVRRFTVENQCTTLPLVSELGGEQRRLLKTLDPTKTHGEIWDALSDNKAATFFQVTHALASVMKDGQPLSSTVERIVYLGGSELTAPDTSGTVRTVIGWRMHVVFHGGTAMDELLTSSGFSRDASDAHPTHKRFGYVRSFRERKGSPKLQIVLNYSGSGADVDLDAGAFHRSSPHDIYENFAKRFPEAAEIYKVK